MKIDSHQHFWKYNKAEYPWMEGKLACCQRDFLPADLAPLLETGGLDGCIAVQARQTLEETDFLLALAEQNPFIKGIVGWVPFCEPDVEEHLDRYTGHPKTVGFRHVIHDEPDDQFILRPDFNAGISKLGRHPLCYDILIFERHLPQTITFVDQHPALPMVVDHVAKPRIRRKEFDQSWAVNIRRLAERENITCKLSGMVTETEDDDWNEDLLKPYFETVLEAFGAGRLMFGSDWPVCLMRSTHNRWLETVRSLISPLSESEGSAIMGETAQRVYRISGLK